MRSGAPTPSSASALRMTWRGRRQQGEARPGQLGVVDQEALGGVVAVEGGREVAQVERDLVRRQVGRGGGQHLGIVGELAQQRRLARRRAAGEVGRGQAGDVAALGRELADHRADAGVRVLHVEDRVLVVLRFSARSTSKVNSVSALRLSRKKRTASRLVQSIRSRSVT